VAKRHYAARRRAVIVGGSVTVFVLAGAGHVALIHAGLVTWPYMISVHFWFRLCHGLRTQSGCGPVGAT